MNLADDLVELVPTDRDRLRASTFIDGRSDFSVGPAEVARLSVLIARGPEAPAPDRFIFHTAFCGSTLLSRLIDLSGRSLVLREPNCLVDVATWRAALDREERDDPRLPRVLRIFRAMLRRRWEPDEPVVVKPSNWINNLLPVLCEDREHIRPLFLVMPREAFVRAVLRGGSDRLAFAARTGVHLSARGRRNAELVAAALRHEGDQTGKLLALAAVTHAIQIEMFREAMHQGRWGADHVLTLADLTDDPLRAARKAAAVLDLDLPDAGLRDACDGWAARHAKQPDAGFSPADEEAANRMAEQSFGTAVEAALRWADVALGPDQGLSARSQPVTEMRGSGA